MTLELPEIIDAEGDKHLPVRLVDTNATNFDGFRSLDEAATMLVFDAKTAFKNNFK